jgi:hypothetical protein
MGKAGFRRAASGGGVMAGLQDDVTEETIRRRHDPSLNSGLFLAAF